ncbi:addiction module protein [candidate division KSB1 bacterium]|nr:addiction module protein [candidate division KSB1 bacterium]MBL7092586.1 addiction module protein [candidate division KSB1 bacterium]
MTASEIKRMNFTERLQAMEMLWDSLLEDESKIESPAWHEDVLRERMENINNDEAKFISLDELKASRK